MNYQEKTFGYKLLRPIIKPLFKFYFNPKVIGKENIPKKGAFILCGNHTDVHDQLSIMINTKRIIHYLAKKEYFDSKMGWFFKFVGQIPVDRETKNSNVKSEAVALLESGHALGIFPEGTRNMLYCKKDKVAEVHNQILSIMSKDNYLQKIKDNQTKLSQINLVYKLKEEKKIDETKYKELLFNTPYHLNNLLEKKVITKKEYDDALLLPFKYGAVSLASQTNSYIVPFAVKGHYQKRSKDLIIKIGKPYKVGKDLEKENTKLRNKIIELYNQI